MQLSFLDQEEINTSSSCPKCGCNKWIVKTEEGKISILLGSTTILKVSVLCADCQKRIPKLRWTLEVAEIVARKKSEYKPSFRKRYGFILFLIFLFVIIIGYATLTTVIDHRTVMKNASENFAKCYDNEKQALWYNDLKAGDFILCNKQYTDDLQVYEIYNIGTDTITLKAYQQYIPLEKVTEIEDLNKVRLGQGTATEYLVKTKYFRRGILEEVSDDVGGPNNYYIKQIKKNK